MSYSVRPLSASTWNAFAELVLRNNGIYGGCWCISYHPECGQKGLNYREVKEDRVKTGRAHAALVFDNSGKAQGWCQYGSLAELPGPEVRGCLDWTAASVHLSGRLGAAVLAAMLELRRRASPRPSSPRQTR